MWTGHRRLSSTPSNIVCTDFVLGKILVTNASIHEAVIHPTETVHQWYWDHGKTKLPDFHNKIRHIAENNILGKILATKLDMQDLFLGVYILVYLQTYDARTSQVINPCFLPLFKQWDRCGGAERNWAASSNKWNPYIYCFSKYFVFTLKL